MSRSDTDENLEQENIEGVGMQIVKINNLLGRSHPRQREGVSLREENPPRRPTPRRDALASARSNNGEFPKRCVDQSLKMHKCMTPDEP